MFNLFKKQIFGLDISDHSIDVAVLDKKAGRIILSQYGHVKLDKGVVNNGRIFDPKRLIRSLSQVLKLAQPDTIKAKELIFSLPASRTFTHFFEVAKESDDDKLEDIIFNKASEVIPVDLKECYVDYKITDENKGVQQVFFVAAPKEIVDSYLKIFSQLKLKPIALDLENFCTSKALIPADFTKTLLALLDLGARTTTVSIFENQNLVFTSSIPRAGNYFNEVLMEELRISEDEAKELKKVIGLDSKQENEKVKLTLQKALQNIIIEVKKIIDYYEDIHDKKIGQIIMCGGSAKMPGIDEYFAKELSLKVEKGQYQIEIPKDLIIDPILLADAIGSALRGLDKKPAKVGINLLP